MENIENQVVSKTNEEKTFSQSDIDNAIAAAKSRWEKKVDRDYVSKEQYENLQSQLNELSSKIKTPNIKDKFLSNGGVESAFNDYVKLNNNLYSIENDNDLVKAIEETKTKQSYMFKKPSIDVSTPVSSTQKKSIYWEGTLIRKE